MKKIKDTELKKNSKSRIPRTDHEIIEQDIPSGMNEITWRIFRIMAEFVEGFEFLADSEKEITIFGSARSSETSHWYKEARKLGGILAKNGFTVITGGGPGVMEAANRGAFEKKGVSLGLNIQLPLEQRINDYVTRGRGFHYFFTRKVMLAASAQAYVFFPGGFGTLDEFFEMVMLIQTGKAQRIPIVLVGKEYWRPLLEWLRRRVFEEERAVKKEDLEIYTVVDTAEEAFALVKDSKERTIF